MLGKHSTPNIARPKVPGIRILRYEYRRNTIIPQQGRKMALVTSASAPVILFLVVKDINALIRFLSEMSLFSYIFT